LLDQGPKLIWQGLTRFDLGLLALGLDLVVPPLTLFVVGVSSLAAANAAACVVLGLPAGPALLSVGVLGAVGASVAVAWVTQGRDLVPLRYAFLVPGYVLWKIPLYFAFATRRKQATWEQTERTPSPPTSP
jgi:hypothetical protein